MRKTHVRHRYQLKLVSRHLVTIWLILFLRQIQWWPRDNIFPNCRIGKLFRSSCRAVGGGRELCAPPPKYCHVRWRAKRTTSKQSLKAARCARRHGQNSVAGLRPDRTGNCVNRPPFSLILLVAENHGQRDAIKPAPPASSGGSRFTDGCFLWRRPRSSAIANSKQRLSLDPV